MKARRAAAAALAGVGIGLLGGCGGGDAGGVALDGTPPPSAAATTRAPTADQTAPTTDAPVSEEDKALAAYREFYRAMNQVAAEPGSDVEATLKQVATGNQYAVSVRKTRDMWDEGRKGYGSTVVHPSVASLTGDRAVIHDCRDTSKTGEIVIKTGEKKTVGFAEDSSVSKLSKVDGVWKVSDTANANPADVYC